MIFNGQSSIENCFLVSKKQGGTKTIAVTGADTFSQ